MIFFPSLYKFRRRFLLKLCCHNDTWFHLKLTNAFFLWKCLSSAMLMYYAFTPNSVIKSVLPLGSEPTWKTSMLYSNIVPLIYVNETICMVICPSSRFKLIILWPKIHHLVPRLSQNTSYGWGAWCHSVMRHSFLSLTDCWWLYNIQLKTSRGVLFLPPSDAYVRSFLYLLYTLIKLCYTKALSDQASSLALDWILLQGPRIPVS